MRYALMSEPQQGLAYVEILALARAVEAAPALGAYFRSDHYGSFPGPGDQPTTDAWATLAGLARETSRIGLGTLVSPVTYRLPGNLAKVVATVDEMSGGRVELGLGAGWHEREHAAHGFAFPPLPERYDMLEETLAIVHGLWREPDGWSYEGAHWQVRDAAFRPRPQGGPGRPHPPLILGGEGGRRFASLAARYADEVNIVSATPERVRRAYARVREACAEIGRDPGELTYSAMTGFLVAATEADLAQRIQDQIAFTADLASDGATDAEAWLAERRTRWVIGTPDEARARIELLASAGVERLMLQDFLPRDLDMVADIGRIVAG
jgi:F420-dependent oxidoreductase-like protein